MKERFGASVLLRARHNPSCQTVNNPFILGTPQRGIEFGGYPNNGNFIWCVAYRRWNRFGLRRDHGACHAQYKRCLSARPPTNSTWSAIPRAGMRFRPLDRPARTITHRFEWARSTTTEKTSRILAAALFAFTGKRSMSPSTGSVATCGSGSAASWKSTELACVVMTTITLTSTLGPGPFTKRTAVTFTGGFVAANYWIYPWLIATMRYDFVNSPSDYFNGVSRYRKLATISGPGYQILVRANIKIVGEYTRHWRPVPYQDISGNPLFYRPNTFVTGIDYAF